MECRSPSKEELLASIKPEMRLTKDFIKRIYGYEISYPGFSDKAIAALEKAGCSRARQYYEEWVAEYEAAYRAEIQPVAEWFQRECEKQWEKKLKEGEEQRTQKERKQISKKWMDGLY